MRPALLARTLLTTLAAASVEWLAPAELPAGRAATLGVRVADVTPPDSVTLWARAAGGYEFAVTVARAGAGTGRGSNTSSGCSSRAGRGTPPRPAPAC